MKAIQLVKYGDSAEAFKIAEVYKPAIGSAEVLIKTKTFGLNFADVMARRGLYKAAPPLPAVLGYDVVGEIAELGQDVKDFKIGQKVVAFTRFGGYAEYAKTDSRAIAVIPEEMDNGEATALSTQYCTAYYAAYDMANIQKREWVLIHAAAGGVGIALIQLAKKRACRVIGTAGSEEKLAFLKELGVDYAINYRDKDFSTEIPKLLGNDQPDVIFDPVGGKSFKKGRKLLNIGGRIVGYGASDQLNRKKSFLSGIKLMLNFGFLHPVSLMINSSGVLGVNMLKIADYKPEILQRTLKNVVDLAIKKEIKPFVGKEFDASDIALAHDFFENRKSIGKIVLHW